MSNFRKLEVYINNSSQVELAYWDTLHGDDVVLVLNAGVWYRRDWSNDDKEVLTPINLGAVLRGIAERQD